MSDTRCAHDDFGKVADVRDDVQGHLNLDRTFFLVKTPNATMISNVIQSEGRKCLSLIEVVGTASKGET